MKPLRVCVAVASTVGGGIVLPASRALAAGCAQSQVPQFFVGNTSSTSAGNAGYGVSGVLELHSYGFTTSGCDYTAGLPVIQSVHLRASGSLNYVELVDAERMNSTPTRYMRTFSEVSDAGNVSTWTYRDPNISETADSVAPCHQTIGLYTTFKVERLNQTPDGRWTWQLVMDCNAGGGWQQLDNRSSHFKAGRSLGEFEAQFSGVEQYAHEYGLRERVNSTWNSWSGIQCDPTPQFMTTHVAPVSNSEYVTSTSGSVC